MLVVHEHSGKYMPRSGLQWDEVHDGVKRYLWECCGEGGDGEPMPQHFTTTGLEVSLFRVG